MKIKYYYIILLAIITFSCKYNTDGKSCNPIVDGSEVKINFGPNDSKNKKFEEIIEVKEIIPLENRSNIYITDVDKCIKLDSNFYVLDKKYSKLLVYNKQGKFLHEIGKLGNAIGEFENISQFFLDEKMNIVIYSSESHKILTYNTIGSFLREKKVPFYAQSLVKINENKYAFYIDYNPAIATKHFNLVFTDSLLKVESKYFKYPENSNGATLAEISGGLYDSSNGSSLVYGAFQDSIFEITNQKDIIKLKYVVNFRKNKLPERIKKDPSNSMLLDQKIILNSSQLGGAIYQTDSLLSLTFFEDRIYQNAFFDLSNKNLYMNSDFSGYTKCLGKTVGVFENNFISSMNEVRYKRSVINNPKISEYMMNKFPLLYKKMNMMYNDQSNPMLIIWGKKNKL